MRRKLLTLLFLAVCATGVRADFNDGVVALMTGDYDKALSILVPLAETADHAFAQYFVGRMYAAGQGVEKSMETAADWYRKAAELGVADAQFRLGALYQEGDGVPQDMESAYGWYSVAAHLGNAKAAAAVETSKALLSPGEMKEAAALSADLIAKYGNAPKSTVRSQ
jgi:TPR repeat protein